MVRWHVGGGRSGVYPASEYRRAEATELGGCTKVRSGGVVTCVLGSAQPGFPLSAPPCFFFFEKRYRLFFFKCFGTEVFVCFICRALFLRYCLCVILFCLDLKRTSDSEKMDRLKTVTRNFNPNNKKQIFFQEELGKKKTCTS